MRAWERRLYMCAYILFFSQCICTHTQSYKFIADIQLGSDREGEYNFF